MSRFPKKSGVDTRPIFCFEWNILYTFSYSKFFSLDFYVEFSCAKTYLCANYLFYDWLISLH